MRTKDEIWSDVHIDENKVPDYKLPCPLKKDDGSSVKTAYEWMNFQRPKILKMFGDTMYGEMPGRPDILRFELLSIRNDALDNTAIRKEIRIHCAMNDGRSHSFDMLLYIPKAAKKPVPVFLGLNFNGNHACTDEKDVRITRATVSTPDSYYCHSKADETSRGTQCGRWCFRDVINRGYASATIHYGEIMQDSPDGFANSIFTLFHTQKAMQSENRKFGAIGAWAWGLMRALDCLENEPLVDSKKVLLHGHSRLGKTALWTGACDPRFAMVISNDSGCCGAALSMRAFGENLEWLLYWRTYWFTTELLKYTRREQEMPFDQHELIALQAPRPVCVASADKDFYADPKGEFLSAVHAAPVYKLFGVKGLGTDIMPGAGEAVDGDAIHYHLRKGEHDIRLFDWNHYMDFADKYLH